MGLSAESKLEDIIADPHGYEVLERHIPGAAKGRLTGFRYMTLEQLHVFGKISQKELAAIDEELKVTA